MKTIKYRTEMRIPKLGKYPGYWKPISNHDDVEKARIKANRSSSHGQRVRILKITTEELPR